MDKRNMKRMLGFALLVGVLGGALVAALSPGGLFSPGWLAAGILLALAVFFLMLTWQSAGGGRRLAVIMILTFTLRLGLGLILEQALPVWGNDEDTHNAGYIFFDAYHRDNQAWDLAQSSQPLSSAFDQNHAMDQYGGLLWLSAFVYRVLSPDVHRSALILILGAFTATLGVIFLYRAALTRFDAKVASAAAWIYALYPESVLQGASQMREPFLMGLSAIAFWAVVTWRSGLNRIQLLLIGTISLLGMALFSWRAALPVAGVLVLWFWLENMADRSPDRWWRWLFWGGVVLAAAAALIFSWEWLRESAGWDATLTERASGMIQAQLEKIPEVLQMPFLVVYGLTQPVLPAAVFEKSLPINTIISTWRALGWYALLPLLVYAVFAVWRAVKTDRRVLVLMAAVSWGWIVISSARAGGDLWDNPRYRTILIIWLALLAGVAWVRARETHDPWLWRWLAVEGIFLAFFTQWYLSRYFGLGGKLSFFVMIGLIVAISVLFLAGCVFWDRHRRLRKQV